MAEVSVVRSRPARCAIWHIVWRVFFIMAVSVVWQSQIGQITIGTTQLADHMKVCSLPLSIQFSPTDGHIAILVEDLSNSIVPNTDLLASITCTDTYPFTWASVTLTEWTPAMAMGEVGNKKKIRLFYGDAPFSGGGQSLRWNIESINGVMAILQGVTLYGTP